MTATFSTESLLQPYPATPFALSAVVEVRVQASEVFPFAEGSRNGTQVLRLGWLAPTGPRQRSALVSQLTHVAVTQVGVEVSRTTQSACASETHSLRCEGICASPAACQGQDPTSFPPLLHGDESSQRSCVEDVVHPRPGGQCA